MLINVNICLFFKFETLILDGILNVYTGLTKIYYFLTTIDDSLTYMQHINKY